jgi:hypothetical protein
MGRVSSLRINSHPLRNLAVAAATLVFVLLCARAATAEPIPTPTRPVYAPGEIVAIPAAIPHEEGDMVDRRILPDLRWIAARFPIFVTDGYSGPLLNGEHAGCNNCHVKNSDHYNGLAVDIVPRVPSSICDAKWTGITRLANWAEPVQNKPRLPFRWVGYEGDSGHGCGHHLHLSWNHAVALQFQLAEWVEVFPAGKVPPVTQQPPPRKAKKPPAPTGPPGGVGQARTGGLAARGHGD